MSHEDRMKEIGKWLIPPEGTPEREKLEELINHRKKLNPNADKDVRKYFEIAVADSSGLNSTIKWIL